MKVSVLIPMFNCQEWIGPCLESVINQTYANLEIIISDDCSIDRSAEIVQNYCAIDERIKLIRHPKNLGCLHNYNYLLRQASGDLLALQDADDWSEVDRLAKQVDIFENKNGVVLVGTDGFFHYPQGMRMNIKPNSGFINGIQEPFPSIPASIMFRSSLLKEVPGMNAFFSGGTSMDRYFIMELLENKIGYHINEPLYHARFLADSNSRSIDEQKVYTEYLFDELLKQRAASGTDWLKEKDYDMLAKYRKVIINPSTMSEAYRRKATYLIDANSLKPALSTLYNSWKLNPFDLKKLQTLSYLIRKKLGMV
jgi:glycosyltransferase involved in cell wall biosynthesis